MPARNASDRAVISSVASNHRWAHVPDRSSATAPARGAFDARFETEVDPEGLLSPEERAKRVANARAAYFGRLALLSAQARRRGAS